MRALEVIEKHLIPGQVYRRAYLSRWSNAIDRHLQELQQRKSLVKLSRGLYYCPKNFVFGTLPPADEVLIQRFLKDSRFLFVDPNLYNALGVGLTQLYNGTVVYNHKRHGVFKLGGRIYRFVRKSHFPQQLSKTFLLVDLVDKLHNLPENHELALKNIKRVALTINREELKEMVRTYGGVKAHKFFTDLRRL